MAMFGGGGDGVPGGFHQDVMGAHPSDNVGRKALSEECKARARGALGSKNYPEAVALYGKSIEVMGGCSWATTDTDTGEDSDLYAVELAANDAYLCVLHANRSMCQLNMGRAEEAAQDAQRAIALDKSYAKGYYRRGAALIKLLQWEQAGEVLAAGIVIKPGDKDLLALQDRAAFALANPSSTPRSKTDKADKAEERAGVPQARASVSTTASVSSSKPAVKPKAPVSSLPPTKPAAAAAAAVAAADGEKEEEIRGYKLTSDGRKTTFFNNEMDARTKELIGDIAPKKLEGLSAVAVAPVEAATGSAWNTAGTFESKSLTSWSRDTLGAMLQKAQCVVVDGTVIKITAAAVDGDGEVVAMRGKRKHIYDFSATLDWSALFPQESGSGGSLGSGTHSVIKGTLLVNDIEADEDCDIDVQGYAINTGKPTAEQRAVLQQQVRAAEGQLQAEVRATCAEFRRLFKSK